MHTNPPDRGIRAAIARANRACQRVFMARVDRKIAAAHDRIVVMQPGADRGDALVFCASLHRRQAANYRKLPPVPLHGEGARTRADVHEWSAVLLSALAGVEFAVLVGGRRSFARTSWRMDMVNEVAGPILDRMESTGNPDDRWSLINDLHAAVLPLVGVEAAETLWIAALTPCPATETGMADG